MLKLVLSLRVALVVRLLHHRRATIIAHHGTTAVATTAAAVHAVSAHRAVPHITAILRPVPLSLPLSLSLVLSRIPAHWVHSQLTSSSPGRSTSRARGRGSCQLVPPSPPTP